LRASSDAKRSDGLIAARFVPAFTNPFVRSAVRPVSIERMQFFNFLARLSSACRAADTLLGLQVLGEMK
jgi:hypothetical protein